MCEAPHKYIDPHMCRDICVSTLTLMCRNRHGHVQINTRPLSCVRITQAHTRKQVCTKVLNTNPQTQLKPGDKRAPHTHKSQQTHRSLLWLPSCFCQHLGRGCSGIRGAGQLTEGAGSMCSFCFDFTLSDDARERMMLHNWVWRQA